MMENFRPAIRFDEFTEDWERRKLREVAEFNPKSELPDEFEYVDLESVVGTEMISHRTENKVSAPSRAQRLAQVGDVFFQTVRPYQRNNFLFLRHDNNYVFSTGYAQMRPHIDATFLLSFLQTENFVKNVLNNCTGTSYPAINSTDLSNLMIVLPLSIDEQTKIGHYMASLSKLITFHQNKYDKIVCVRASMLEKLFARDRDLLPQIRFGEYKAPWKKVRLGEIVVPYSDPVETPHDGYERLGIRSHGKGVFHDYVDAGKELGTAQMHRVASHNLIVNITFAWEHAVAITDDNDAGKLVSHRFPQFAMTDDIYDQFLKYMILDAGFRHHLLLSSPGGAGRNRVLKVSEMLEYEMMIPEVEEQKQIADYLNSLDELISLYKVRVQELKNIKMACLQKMFV